MKETGRGDYSGWILANFLLLRHVELPDQSRVSPECYTSNASGACGPQTPGDFARYTVSQSFKFC